MTQRPNRSVPSRAGRVLVALLSALLLAVALAVPAAGPAGATAATLASFTGDAEGWQEKEWFNHPFDFDAGELGRLRGRLRFETETTATVSASRAVSTGDGATYGAGGSIAETIVNGSGPARLAVTARPALQLLFEWQPQGDPVVCDVTTFPDLADGEWFRRTDGSGPVSEGVCGAIEVTADDLNPIFQQLGLDLELPEVFALLDRVFAPGFSGTANLTQTHELFELKVCKIIDGFFRVPLGDRCGLQLNAVIGAPLTTLAQTITAQACTSFFTVQGTEVPCSVNVGAPQSLTFASSSRAVTFPGICPQRSTHYDVRVSDVRWQSRLEDVTIGLSIDFNVRLLQDGEGKDLVTINLPGSISLLNAPMPLDVAFTPNSAPLHVGIVNPDTRPPTVALDPVTMVNEGSTATLAPVLDDNCTATEDLTVDWTIDSLPVKGDVLQRTYLNDRPNPSHEGVLRVTDADGNAREVPFEIRVRNVAPAVTLNGIPKVPVPINEVMNVSASVADPGSDVVTWSWSFGDGSFATRTAAGVSDRVDTRAKSYTLPWLYTIRAGVDDGTSEGVASREVAVFDPASKLVGTGSFTADDKSIGVPAHSVYRMAANLAYRGGSFPVGSFVSEFTRIVGNGTQPARLEATSLEWYLERPSTAMLQGLATVNGESGWKFRAGIVRDATSPIGSVATVAVWRPGVTTIDNPDYRFGGPRDTGNMV